MSLVLRTLDDILPSYGDFYVYFQSPTKVLLIKKKDLENAVAKMHICDDLKELQEDIESSSESS